MLRLTNDNYGTREDLNICLLIEENQAIFNDFVNMYFEIMSNTNKHDYTGSISDQYAVATLVKKLNISSECLVVTKPKIIEKFY